MQLRKFIFIVLFGFQLCAGFSQDLSQHNWYFGTTINGIKFNRATNKPQLVTNKGIPYGSGGCAVATDPATGDLLFYTDGFKVFDANHNVMTNGTFLNADTTANQPAVVCAVPGQVNKYFIFTNTSHNTTGGGIFVTVVDMALFGKSTFPEPPFGQVVTKNVAIASLTNRSEGMTLIPHSNGTDFWLITHQNSTQNYTATQITAASFTGGTYTNVVSSGLGLPTSVANFYYNHKNKKLAVSAQDNKTDAIILNFNNTTGALTFDQTIFNTGAPAVTQSIYDIQWDIEGQYIYISRNGQAGVPADLLQYDYKNPATTLASVLPAPIYRSWGLQLAPDSTIYHIYQSVVGGNFLLAQLTKTDTIAAVVVWTPGLYSNTNFGGSQFPQFLPQLKINLNLSFTFTGLCQGNPTSFFPSVTPNADSLNWNFGDGKDTTAWSPVHTYANSGSFPVKLTAYYQGQKQSVTNTVTITSFQLKLQLVQDTTACRSEFPPPRGSSSPTQFSVKVKVTQGNATSFNWSNGNTGQILKPDSAGYYYVVATDATGCSTYAGVNVKEYGLNDRRTNRWYFGNKAGIDFNKIPPKPLNNSAMNAPAGCAIVCDRNGQAIFYTDGDKVYDKTDTQIDSGIGGDPNSSQSALIVNVPGDETLYYIFTTQAINGVNPYELRYSLFDLKMNGGKGAVTQKNILLFSKSTERVTASGKWLVAHEYGNNTFRVYPITAKGIGDPIYSAIGSDHSFLIPENGEGYMKLGPKNNLAVALSTPNVSNLIELFHLNDTTGVITNYRKINLKHNSGQVYGIEFSNTGNKLFATVKGSPTPSELYEYFIDSIGHPYFKQVSVQNTLELGALQMAPDGQIYIAINGSGTMGTIQAVDDTTKFSNFNFSGFALSGGTNSRLGLPNFIQQQGNAFGGPGFTYGGVCVGDSTRFSGVATDAIDKFQWFFGDGGSSTKSSPVHLFAAAGKYNVSMRIYNRCKLDTTITKVVTILPPPPKPTLPLVSPLCTTPITLNANTGNLPSTKYLWSTGDTTKTIIVKAPAILSVKNTDINGCSSLATGIVVDSRPKLDLGPDITLCQNTPTLALDALNPGDSYQWQVNAVNANTIQKQAVDTSIPGKFTYSVKVTDPVTLCNITVLKTFTVNVSPSISMSGINPTACGTATGTIKLSIATTAPAGGPYSYFMTGPSGFNQQNIDQVAPIVIASALKKSGTYSAIVSDQVSGCSSSIAYALVDNVFTIAASVVPPNCSPVTLKVTTNAASFPLSYTVTDDIAGTTTATGSSGTSVFNLGTALLKGTYTIQVTDNNGCVNAVNGYLVNPNVAPTLTLTPDLCSNPNKILAAGGSTYTWTGSGITSALTANPVTIAPGIGQFTYTVTTPGPGCPANQSITVNVNNAITPDFTQSNPCADNVILTATPQSATYTYRWYKGASLQTTGQLIALPLSENGASYQLEIVDSQTGCTVRSTVKVVQVIGIVDASLTSTLACDDGKAFTLTSTTIATGPVTYSWTLNSTAIAGSAATLSSTDAGTYEVKISKGVCSATASLMVSRAPLPMGRLPVYTVICDDPTNKDTTSMKVVLDPGSFTRYKWFKNQLPLNDTLRSYTATSAGLYEVDLTNSLGCTNTNKTEVRNDCEPKIAAPNAFRPSSGADSNKTFFVYTFFITDSNFEVVIFNRWGEMVFESKDRNFKWNGGYNNSSGQPLPGGTYAYVIKYISSFHPERGTLEQQGGIVLLR